MKYEQIEAMTYIAEWYWRLQEREPTEYVLSKLINYIKSYSFQEVMELDYSHDLKMAILDFQNSINKLK